MPSVRYSIALGQPLESVSFASSASFTASITTTVLNVTAVASGVLGVGQSVSGAGIAAGTVIASLGTGTGGIGTYNLNNSQAVGSEAMTSDNAPSAGAGTIELRIDQTPSTIKDASVSGGQRSLNKGEIYTLIGILEQYLIKDINVRQ